MACAGTTVCLSARLCLSIVLVFSVGRRARVSGLRYSSALFVDVRDQISGMWAQRKSHEMVKL